MMRNKANWLAPLAVLLFAAGCGKPQGPISSETSKYQVAEKNRDKNPASSDPGQSNPPASNDSEEVAQKPPIDPAPPKDPVSPPRDPVAPAKPPTVAGSSLNPYATEETDPEKLMAYVDELREKNPQGNSREEQRRDFENIHRARIAACEKVLATAKDEELRLNAAEGKFDALQVLEQIGVPGAVKMQQDFADSLEKDKDPKVAEMGRLMRFGMKIDAMASGDEPDPKVFLTEIKQLIEDLEKSERAFQMAATAAQILARLGHAESADGFEMVGKAYAEHENEELAAAAKQLIDAAAQTRVALAERDRLVELQFEEKLNAALENGGEAKTEFVAMLTELLSAEKLGATVLENVSQAAQYLELTGNYSEAQAVYTKLGEAYTNHETKELAETAKELAESGAKRMALIGKPLPVVGVTLDGKPFDWKSYRGKLVLVDFWASWCGPCLAELPNIKENYTKYKDQGFEVVGVNLDDDQEAVDNFFSVQKLPWATIRSANPETQGFENPLAVHCGINAIPFIALVDKEGVVIALHVRGKELGEKLKEMLGPAEGEEAPSDPPPEEDAPADEPVEDAPAIDPPAEDQSNLTDTAATWFVALLEEEEEAAADEEAPKPTKEEEEKAKALLAEEYNPYLAGKDLSAEELVDFVLDMQEKPKSIQNRAGFSEAILEASRRLLKIETKDAHHCIAAEVAFEILHRKASFGDAQADEQLQGLVEELKNDQRSRIAKEVAFYQLERKVMDAEKLELAEVPPLLDSLKEYYAAEKLTDKHLRLASSTVAAINRIEEAEAREKLFTEFGNLFAKSSDKELSRYGSKLAKGTAKKPSDLIGKPLELAGVTAAGVPFNWENYRGKVILVDFWATWCGPCRREMPHVKALHEKHGDKDFAVVGISLDKDLEALATFLEEQAIPWENLAGDDTQDLATRYGVRGIPTMMLIDREGKIVDIAHQVEKLTPALEKMLAEEKTATKE